MFRRAFGVLLVLPLLAFQGEDVKSGPAAGEDLPGAFHALNVNGAHAGNPHCLVCENGLNPVVAIFARSVPEANSPLADVLQKLDQAALKNQRQGLGVYAVFLTPDIDKEAPRTELVRRLEDLIRSADLKQAILALYGNDGPEKYKIHPDADVTILLYRKYKVVANHAYRKDKMTAKDVEAILAELPKLLKSDG